MTASDAEAVLGQKVERFRKTTFSVQDTLDVGPGILHLSFDAAGGCSGVELFSDSGASLTMSGQELLVRSAERLVETLGNLGQAFEIDEYGVHVPGLGIATFSPAFDWPAGLREVDALFVSLDPDFVP